jgi:hypothetical protein
MVSTSVIQPATLHPKSGKRSDRQTERLFWKCVITRTVVTTTAAEEEAAEEAEAMVKGIEMPAQQSARSRLRKTTMNRAQPNRTTQGMNEAAGTDVGSAVARTDRITADY